ncbi:MAG: carbohydrate kinase family protein [Promethearchaeota archaeon]
MNPNPKFDVVVVGAAGVDTNIYLYQKEIDFSVEANFTENIDCVGQAGAYYARGFARLGYNTSFFGSFGEDSCGQFVREAFRGDNIDISDIFVDPKGTKRSVNFMYPDGRRKNFYDGKGHMEISVDMAVAKSLFQNTRLIHFNLMNWSRALLRIAKECGVTISCDLQDIVEPDDPYRLHFIQEADILFFSCVNFPDPKPVINFIHEQNPTALIIGGMGKDGCVVAQNKRLDFFPAINLPDRPIIDSNGAGDELAVGFLSSFLFDGYSLEDAILRGQISARYTCSLKAGTDSLISKTQLDSYYDSKKQKKKIRE